MGWEVTGQIVVENAKSGLVRAVRVRWRGSASGALRDAICVFRRDNSF